MKRPLCFATDASLGKLGRHLRAAGFDTCCEHQSQEADFWNVIGKNRIVLTRTVAVQKRFNNRRHLFVRHNDPWRQIQQVVQEMQVTAADIEPFSRCLTCNHRLHSAERETVRGRVPDYVWQRYSSFQVCDQCRRIYWPGSHRQRMEQRLANLFLTKERDNS